MCFYFLDGSSFEDLLNRLMLVGWFSEKLLRKLCMWEMFSLNLRL